MSGAPSPETPDESECRDSSLDQPLSKAVTGQVRSLPGVVSKCLCLSKMYRPPTHSVFTNVREIFRHYESVKMMEGTRMVASTASAMIYCCCCAPTFILPYYKEGQYFLSINMISLLKKETTFTFKI